MALRVMQDIVVADWADVRHVQFWLHDFLYCGGRAVRWQCLRYCRARWVCVWLPGSVAVRSVSLPFTYSPSLLSDVFGGVRQLGLTPSVGRLCVSSKGRCWGSHITQLVGRLEQAAEG
jgi:hypothetical protein